MLIFQSALSPPHTNPSILHPQVVDPAAEECWIVPGAGRGANKWSGLVAAGDRLLCVPSQATDVLVLDPADPAEGLSLDFPVRKGKAKWSQPPQPM